MNGDPRKLADTWIHHAHLQNYVSAVRSEFQQYHPNLPIIIAEMATTNRGAAFPYIGYVREAQSAMTELGNLLSTDMEGLDFWWQVRAP